ncbi:MAG: metallophosphoesterase [Firmicutes bacterium]|nr:metallophosphoesterase [Bacillota bacterium]
MNKKLLYTLPFIGLLVQALRRDTAIRKYILKDKRIQKNFRALLLSDFHSSFYGDGQKKLTSLIDRLNPEILFFAGDIFDDKKAHKNSWILFEKLSQKYRCFFVTGNHEYWSMDCPYILKRLKDMGVEVLENEYKDYKGVRIFGINDPAAYSEDINTTDTWRQILSDLNKDCDEAHYNLLLTHRPENIKEYSETNMDTVLSGHAHGGQLIFPFINRSLWAPNQGWFPKYTSGIFRFKNFKLIISRGLCRNIFPRIFNRPEIIVLDFKKDEI